MKRGRGNKGGEGGERNPERSEERSKRDRDLFIFALFDLDPFSSQSKTLCPRFQMTENQHHHECTVRCCCTIHVKCTCRSMQACTRLLSQTIYPTTPHSCFTHSVISNPKSWHHNSDPNIIERDKNIMREMPSFFFFLSIPFLYVEFGTNPCCLRKDIYIEGKT